MASRKKAEMPIGQQLKIVALSIWLMVVIGILAFVFFSKNPPPAASIVEDSPPAEATSTYDANSKAGEIYGSSMGSMIGGMGKSYPSAVELESMAKTAAVDAGSTVNDFIFTAAFKRAFARGYREGRASR